MAGVAEAIRSSLIATDAWEEWLSGEMDKDDPVMRQAVMWGITLKNMRSIAAVLLENRDLLEHLGDSDLVLFKGSRAMEMEKAFELCQRALAGKGV